MSAVRLSPASPRMKQALSEMQGLIRGRYPDATFRAARGEDPEGIYLWATVDVEDTAEVVDVYIDRLLELQIDDELPLYVITLRPAERVAELLRARAAAGPFGARRVNLDEDSST